MKRLLVLLALAMLLPVATADAAQSCGTYIKTSTAYRVMFFAESSYGVGVTGKTIPITISKNGGAFGNPSAGATNATEVANGWYYIDLSTTDTGTAGPLAIRGTAAATLDVHECVLVGNAPSDINAINGGATTGNNATLKLAALDITNSGGDAVTFKSTAASGIGFKVYSTQGPGMQLKTDATTYPNSIALDVVSPAGSATYGAVFHHADDTGGWLEISSRLGLYVATDTSGLSAVQFDTYTGTGISGLTINGTGSGNAVTLTPGATGVGLAVNGGATSGAAITATANGSNSNAVTITGNGTGTGVAVTTGTNGTAITATGVGSGNAVTLTAGATGNGAVIAGGATSGAGVKVTAAASNDAVQMLGGGLSGAPAAATGRGLFVGSNTAGSDAMTVFQNASTGDTLHLLGNRIALKLERSLAGASLVSTTGWLINSPAISSDGANGKPGLAIGPGSGGGTAPAVYLHGSGYPALHLSAENGSLPMDVVQVVTQWVDTPIDVTGTAGVGMLIDTATGANANTDGIKILSKTNGVEIVTTNGHAMTLTAGGSSKYGLVGTLSPTTLATFFNTDSGETAATAVAGSVVGELYQTTASLSDFFTVDTGETYATSVPGSIVKEMAYGVGMHQNLANPAYKFDLWLTNGNAATGKTDSSFTTKKYQCGTAAWADLTGTIQEIGRGTYYIPLTAAQTNGARCYYQFQASGTQTTTRQVDYNPE